MAQNASADLDILAEGYLEILRRGLKKLGKGNALEALFRHVNRPYLPSGVNGHLLSRIHGMPPQWEWDVLLHRGQPLQGPWKRPRFDPADVVGLFEIKGYGIMPRSGTTSRGADAIVDALHFKRQQFVAARQCCPHLGLSCYFALQERTPARNGIAYYDFTKQILEAEIMTVIPFHAEFRAGHPIPPMYANAQEEWDKLVNHLVHL